IDTLVISTARHDLADVDSHPPTWQVVEESEHRIVLVRRTPLDHPALSALDGVRVANAESEGTDLRFSVESDEGGRVVIDRLRWPGYRITLDGAPLESSTTPYGLIEVE